MGGFPVLGNMQIRNTLLVVYIGLVILDLNMPGMGGAKCLTHLMDLDSPPRVMIASGYSPKGTVRETLQKGARGYIAKPFHLPDVLKMVREVLDQIE